MSNTKLDTTHTANPNTPAVSTTHVPKKRGKKGDKIANAFASITTTPTDVNQVSKQYGVSIAVLRQAKRFDKTGMNGVCVKKDKTTGSLMIWRESAKG